jgi:hypothetical protein
MLSVKARYKETPKMMGIVARMELEDLPEFIQTCSMVFMPEVGYLLAVPAWRPNLTETDLILPNTELKVSTERFFDVIWYVTVF